MQLKISVIAINKNLYQILRDELSEISDKSYGTNYSLDQVEGGNYTI